jgi:hypothetical protein
MNGEHDQAEEERLRWVQACCIDGSQPLPEFDGLAELAARILSTKISIVTIVTKDEHVFVANHGGMLRRVPRRGLCGFVTKGEQTQRVVLDALEEPQCRDSIWVVNSPFVRFCASVPLVVNNVRVGDEPAAFLVKYESGLHCASAAGSDDRGCHGSASLVVLGAASAQRSRLVSARP